MEKLSIDKTSGESGWSNLSATHMQTALAFHSPQDERKNNDSLDALKGAHDKLGITTDVPPRYGDIRDLLLQIDALQAEISHKHIRDLERMTVRISESRTCQCQSLLRILDRFTAFNAALHSWQIRDRYLLMPTVRERLTAGFAGQSYVEAYPGEFADLVREATMDQHDLSEAADRLHAEMQSILDLACCPDLVTDFAAAMGEFVRRLKLQFHLEQTVLQASGA